MCWVVAAALLMTFGWITAPKPAQPVGGGEGGACTTSGHEDSKAAGPWRPLAVAGPSKTAASMAGRLRGRSGARGRSPSPGNFTRCGTHRPSESAAGSSLGGGVAPKMVLMRLLFSFSASAQRDSLGLVHAANSRPLSRYLSLCVSVCRSRAPENRLWSP